MATKTINYGLTKPEGSDFYDIDVHNGNSDIIDAQLKKLYDAKTGHVGNKSNPHSVTKSQIGLGNVENKSSATIREEMTKANVTKALGYTPATQSDMTNAQNDITQLNSDLNNRIEFTITSIDSKYAFTGNSYKHNGKVYINEQEFEEPYLQSGIVTDIMGVGYDDFVVPENCVFAMGDNRNHSTDCRAFGCIPLEKIESTVAMRIWPLDKWGKVE